MNKAISFYVVLSFLVGGILAGNTAAQDDRQIAFKVKNFQMISGLASQLGSRPTQKYLELVDSQIDEIKKIIDRYEGLGRDVISNDRASDREKYQRLQKLVGKQTKELEAVLLPHQKRRLQGYTVYLLITQQGLVGSTVDGFIGMELDLSSSEKNRVAEAAKKALEEYRKRVDDAQRKSIKQIRDSLPSEKRKDFDEILEPLLVSDSLLWRTDYYMLKLPKKYEKKVR